MTFSIITPAYGDITRLVQSIRNQYHQREWTAELIIEDDNVDNPHDYQQWLEGNPDWLTVSIHNHDHHIYQGKGRQEGFKKAQAQWCLTIDCDDELTPYCLDTLESYLAWDKQQAEQYKEQSGADVPQLACVSYDFISATPDGGFMHIGRDQPTIWVQSRLWNREFVLSHGLTDIYDKLGIDSRRGEDYPWVNLFDFYLGHEGQMWRGSIMPPETPPLAFWTPNRQSLSRVDPYYAQHLSGWTMGSSMAIYEGMRKYCLANGITPEDDEQMKMRLLNQVIYSYYNLYDFVWTVGESYQHKEEREPYAPQREDWDKLRLECNRLRDTLKNDYWDEIQDNDVYTQLEGVLHRSDAHIHNIWDGNFFDYMNHGCAWLDYDYDTMLSEARKLEFDGVNCLSSPKVAAYKERTSCNH